MWERPHVADIVSIDIIIDFFEELPQGIKKINNQNVCFSNW